MTLVLSSCTYAYGRRAEPVVRDFGYELPDGLTVLFGPEGAGKSTLLKLAASEVSPRSGTVSLDGEPGGTKAFRRAVGWTPQDVMPMANLSARDFVAYVGWLKGLGRREAWRSAGQALAKVQLGDQSERKTRQLAADELARLGLATALVHGARVLLLDEPTAGLPLRGREEFHDALTALIREDGLRALLATRDVASVAPLLRGEEPARKGESRGRESGDADGTAVHGVQVAVLDTAQDESEMLYAGTARAFLAHAPEGTPPKEAATAAYRAVHEGTPTQG